MTMMATQLRSQWPTMVVVRQQQSWLLAVPCY